MDAETTADRLEPCSGAWPCLSSDDRFGAVVDGFPIAMVLIDPDGRIAVANRQTERLFGYERGELHGQDVELLMPQRFRGRHVGLRRHALAHRCVRGMGEECDLPGLHKNGTELALEIGLNPLDLDGIPMMLVSIIDITVRHETERVQKQKQHDLERFNADLEEFCYVASHDLKAPLRAIGHLVQWIGEDIEPTASPNTADNLRMLRQRVARLTLLLDGLLHYARIGYQAPEAPEDVDVAEMVHDIAAMLGPPPGFVIACEGDMPVIRIERTPLDVVLENLIANGLKHHDRTEGRITVSMQVRDGEVEFRVTDDGAGIAPRFHDRIFVIFQTLASRDDAETSGIGLAIVKKKVQNHGGRIRVESHPPVRGTTFVFTWKLGAP